MVAKISSGNSIFGALSYNQKKLDEQHANVLFTNRMIEPVDGKYGLGICMRSFEPYLIANQKTENPVLHISLNPDPKDILTEKQYAKIAYEYMQQLGYGNQPFIVYKHEDIDRHHLHIVSIRVDENGRKLDHNFERRKSMEICRKLEQAYHLIPADRKDGCTEPQLKRVQYGEENLKGQIAGIIRSLMKTYHFQSLGEYNALLSRHNITVEEIKGGVGDKPYTGLVYSALDEKGARVGKAFKSSLFGKTVGYDALQLRIKLSGEIIKEQQLKERTKGVILKVMPQQLCRADFEKALVKKSIDVVFRENETGRIYGVTFIDHQSKCVLNGSRLGKEFSANRFNELFSAPHMGSEKQPQHHSSAGHGLSFDPDFVAQRETDAGTESTFHIFSMENNGIDPEEEAFIRRMKKKKKPKKNI